MRKKLTTAIAGLALVLVGCEGKLSADGEGAPTAHPDQETPSLGPGTPVDDPVDPTDQPTDIDECAGLDPTPVADVPARILTTQELNNALDELFGNLDLPEFPMVNDSRVGSFVLNAREQVSTTHVRDFRLMAEDVAARAAGSIDQVAPCDQTDPDALAACAEDAVAALGTRAFRRPLEDAERTALVELWTDGNTEAGHAEGVRYVVEAILQSPSFMYVTEDASADLLDDHEIAQRMAAMLWRSIPDATLAAAAESGELADAANREAQARRMIADPRGRDMMRALVLQWLGLDRLQDEAFADETLVSAMGEETTRLIDHVVEERQSSWVELLSAPYTFVDETMAAHYGVDLADAQEVSPGVYRVEMAERAGLLTHASYLVMHHGPVHRGLAMRKAILCGNVPGPTNVDTEAIPTGPTESERSKSEKRLDSTSCGGCHAMMDPLGLPLEEFGTLGQFRTEDQHGNTMNGEGAIWLAGQSTAVDNAVALAQELTAVEDSRRCIAQNLFTWSFARPPEGADNCTVARVQDALLQGDDNLQEALVQIVAHEMFVRRNLATGE